MNHNGLHRRLGVFALMLLGSIFAAGVRGQVITEFPIPTTSSGSTGITAGPDGALWFTEFTGNKIGRITTAGVFTEFTSPTASSGPTGIAAGSDGALWFTEVTGDKIGRVTTAGVIADFTIPTAGSHPIGIAAGPDGALWFTEFTGNKIGRVAAAGGFVEYTIPTAGSQPVAIATGRDGNLWFTESSSKKIGRITTAGVFTEFPVPALGSADWIAAGPDGALWFTDATLNQIGRITTAGVFTDFTIPAANSGPGTIAAGPDGSLWFTETNLNKIGRVTTAGVFTDFAIPTANSSPNVIAAGPDGALWFPEYAGNNIGRLTTAPLTPQPMAVDAHAVGGSSSNANGVLEPGETVQVAPAWKNTMTSSQSFTGAASNLTGPAGPIYTINDNASDYGTVGAGATQDCNSATGNCYLMTISGTRPAAHWDATFTETLSLNSVAKDWTLHVGDSFPDVPTSQQFYAFIENLFHNEITGGCGGGNYCPANSVTRAQMAVFLMKAKLGAAEMPPPATGTVFADVPASNPFAPWIEQLAHFGVTGGCGGGNYCPNNPVTRAQMAVFLLKAQHGSAYSPPACTGVFPDVPCPSQFADWIEQLHAEGITGGCGGGNYCPNSPNNRGQMAVFLVKTFGLQLYGP